MKDLMELFPTVQNYAWGKKGKTSTVAQLVDEAGGEIKADANYAELWMGTHVSGPSSIKIDGSVELLSEVLKENQDLLYASDEVPFKDEGLPYLFKVLSVNQALSIQAHPSKKHAEQLHKKWPNHYKDDNHKPEMALALTSFEALVGFKSYDEIFENCSTIPELKAIVDGSYNPGEEDQKKNLKNMFSTLMNADEHTVATQVSKLTERLKQKFSKFSSEDLNKPIDDTKEDTHEFSERLAYRVLQTYPGDIGVFCIFLLNYKCLKPGQAIFLAANEPHCYLSGDCAEIMATSDNVVRAGLTPKHRDVDTLCSMLTYTPFDPAQNLLEGIKINDNVSRYAPNDDEVNEFEIERVELKAGESLDLDPPAVACILLVLNGKGSLDDMKASRGKCFFQSAGSKISVKSDEGGLLLLRASTKNSFDS